MAKTTLPSYLTQWSPFALLLPPPAFKTLKAGVLTIRFSQHSRCIFIEMNCQNSQYRVPSSVLVALGSDVSKTGVMNPLQKFKKFPAVVQEVSRGKACLPLQVAKIQKVPGNSGLYTGSGLSTRIFIRSRTIKPQHIFPVTTKTTTRKYRATCRVGLCLRREDFTFRCLLSPKQHLLVKVILRWIPRLTLFVKMNTRSNIDEVIYNLKVTTVKSDVQVET